MEKGKEAVLAALNTFYESGWHAPLSRAVEGLTAEQAKWRPAPGEHCVWEHVNHVAVWAEEYASRLAGGPRRAELSETVEAGWPGPEGRGRDDDWRRAVARLKEAHARLVAIVSAMEEAALARRRAEGKPLLASEIIESATHYSYHGSQIVLLRRLQGTWKPDEWGK